jgi:UTP--glucose-1-phosphate uridylyltransferase
MHVLTPGILDLLEKDSTGTGPFMLSPALARLAQRERYLAFEVRGRRSDIGARYGLLHAQLALALHGRDQRDVLELMIDLLANRELARTG